MRWQAARDRSADRRSCAARACGTSRWLVAFAGGPWLDAVVVAALCGGRHGIADARTMNEAAARRSSTHGSDAAASIAGPVRTVEIVAPGADLRRGLQRHAFPDFGLWIFRSDRLFLAIRCGAIGYAGRGAHAHNDQLSIELTIAPAISWKVA